MKQPKIVRISVKDLTVEPSAQRELTPAHAEAMAKDFRPELVGAIIVSKRAKDYFVIDGQHRVTAARMVNPDMRLLCLVHEDYDVADEAAHFRGINGKGRRRAIHCVDDHKVAVTAKDPQALQVQACLDRNKLRVARCDGPNNVRAVQALHRINRVGNLDATLPLAVAWRKASEDSYAFEQRCLLSLSLFLAQHPEADQARLVQVLAKPDNTPSRFLRRLKYAQDSGIRINIAGPDLLRQAYNKGLRESAKLAPPAAAA